MMPPPIAFAVFGGICAGAIVGLLVTWILLWVVAAGRAILARIRVWFAVRNRPAWIPAAPKPPAPLPTLPSRNRFEAAALPRCVVLAPSPADIENVLTEAVRICRAACTDH